MNEQVTEDRWDVELEDAPPKSGVPVWVWGCGGGCLFALVGVMIFTMWFFNRLRGEIGPERTWPIVQEVMPFTDTAATNEEAVAAAPEGYVCARTPFETIALLGGGEQSEEGVSLTELIHITPGPDPSMPRGTGLSAMLFVFDGVFEGSAIEFASTAFAEFSDAEASRGQERVPLQGRETDSYHVSLSGVDGMLTFLLPGGGDDQKMQFIDITGDRARSVVLTVIATGEVDVTVEGVEELLLPFDVWAGK